MTSCGSSDVQTVLDTSSQDLGANNASAQQPNYVLIGTFTASARRNG